MKKKKQHENIMEEMPGHPTIRMNPDNVNGSPALLLEAMKKYYKVHTGKKHNKK